MQASWLSILCFKWIWFLFLWSVASFSLSLSLSYYHYIVQRVLKIVDDFSKPVDLESLCPLPRLPWSSGPAAEPAVVTRWWTQSSTGSQTVSDCRCSSPLACSGSATSATAEVWPAEIERSKMSQRYACIRTAGMHISQPTNNDKVMCCFLHGVACCCVLASLTWNPEISPVLGEKVPYTTISPKHYYINTSAVLPTILAVADLEICLKMTQLKQNH